MTDLSALVLGKIPNSAKHGIVFLDFLLPSYGTGYELMNGKGEWSCTAKWARLVHMGDGRRRSHILTIVYTTNSTLEALFFSAHKRELR